MFLIYMSGPLKSKGVRLRSEQAVESDMDYGTFSEDEKTAFAVVRAGK
jgi:hypothetical protein